jgi:hypothetical protein
MGIPAGPVKNKQLSNADGPARSVLITVRHAINLPVSGHGDQTVLPTPFGASTQHDFIKYTHIKILLHR